MITERKQALHFNKVETIEALELYYITVLVEDPIGGTNFDFDVLDALKELKIEYCMG